MNDPDRKSAVPVVTVDGPVGVGKGTLSYRLAAHLGFHLLDSGAVYRLLALAARRDGIEESDVAGLVRLASSLDAGFAPGDANEAVRAMLHGEDVTSAIRYEQCGRDASVVAAIPLVRDALLERQRAYRRPPGLVADGRDMGTVVFPCATTKIYLTASPQARAQRRHKQLIEKGIGGTLANRLGELIERDKRDHERPVSPLRPAEDAIVIDTTGYGIEAIFERALGAVVGRGLSG